MSRHERSQHDGHDEDFAARFTGDPVTGADPATPIDRIDRIDPINPINPINPGDLVDPGDPAGSGLGQLDNLPSLSFLPDEWDLLIRLPAQVVIAATSAEPDTARRTVVEGLAGIDAIAGGRAFDSDLVRAVVAAIYTEPDARGAPGAGGDNRSAGGDNRSAGGPATDPLDPGMLDPETPVAQEFADRAAGIAGVLAGCRSATALLDARVDPADSAAYRQWLQSIAARVCEAARSGGVLGVGGQRLSAAEARFLDDLSTALNLA